MGLKKSSGLKYVADGSGGGDGNVDVVETTNIAIIKKTTYSSYFYFDLSRMTFLDDEQYISYTAQTSYGGSNIVGVYKITNNSNYPVGSLQNSITLDFGQDGQTSPISFSNHCDISPDRSKIVISGYGGTTKKIFIVPLINTNGAYSLGTPVEYATPDVSNHQMIKFVDNDTVVICGGYSGEGGAGSNDTLYAYKIENGVCSLLSTFQNTNGITGILTIGETILMQNVTNKTITVIDNMMDQNVIYTETSSDIMVSLRDSVGRCFSYKNKFFIQTTSSNNRPYKILSLDNGVITTFTFSSNAVVNSISGIVYVLYDDNNGKIGLICSGTYNYRQLFILEYDFNNSTCKDVSDKYVINNALTNSSFSGSLLLCKVGDTKFLYLMASYTSSYSCSGFILYDNIDVAKIINYEGWQYSLTDKASS